METVSLEDQPIFLQTIRFSGTVIGITETGKQNIV